MSLLYEEELPYAKKLEENCNAKEIKFFRIEKAFQSIFLKDNKVKNHSMQIDMKLASLVNSSKDLKYMARRAFNSFCRAYSLLKDTDCFNLK